MADPNQETASSPQTASAGMWQRPPVAVSMEQAGDFVGPYKLLSVLGEGGFGVVWLAERREPMVQRVALKIIRPGMDSAAVIARFEQERQALAVMDHPNVAKVYDAGATPHGRPYFVMEHVQGERITQYCDRHVLTIRQRVELFVQVCEAVQHAHQKGIIHRDIKPSNILVAVKDGRPIPKVIDFGVAKAVTHTLTERTIFTEQGQLIGTPEYMSPEQAEMGAVDIDTRTDVYSLGVVLYELIAGLLPFDPRTLRAAGYDAIRMAIRVMDPPKPSTRLTAADENTGADIAAHRQAQREQLARELRRELDWIPMKALRKDRTGRYDSAAELAKDLRRYLAGEPLEAGPESAPYRIRKFLKRHRRAVLAGSIVAGALMLGTAGTSAGLIWAIRERDRAEAQVREQKWASAQLLLVLAVVDDRRAAPDRSLDRVTAILKLFKEIGKEDEPEAVLAHAEMGRLLKEIERPGAVESFRTAEALGWRLFEQGGDCDLLRGLAITVNTGEKTFPLPLVLSAVLSGVYEEIERTTVRDGDNAALVPLLSRRAAVERCMEESTNETDTLIRQGSAELAIGHPEQARAAFTAAADALRRCFRGDAHPVGYADRHRAIACGLAESGDQGGALRVLDAASRAYAQGQPSDRRCMLEACARVNWLLSRRDAARECASAWDAALVEESAPLRADPRQWGVLLWLLEFRGQALECAGRGDEAERVLREGLGISRSRDTSAAHWAEWTGRLTGLLSRGGHVDRAKEASADHAGFLRERGLRDDLSAEELNGLAWEWLTMTSAEFRDPELALGLARRAVSRAEGKGPGVYAACLDTLALACMRTGDVAQAVEVGRRAVATCRMYDRTRIEYKARLAEYGAAPAARGAGPPLR